MLPKIILKCAFLFTISRVSAFFVLKINNLDEDEMVSTVMKVVNKSTARNAEHTILNNIAFRGMDLLNYLGSRKSGNRKKYLNRRLVKRIVPHGYEVDDIEFDEKFQTMYKPLVRIHKKKTAVDASNDSIDENKYELVLVLDYDQYKDDPKVLDDLLLKPFTIDNMDIKYFPNDKNIDDEIRITENSDYDKTKHKLLDQIAHLNANNLLQGKFRDDLRPQKKNIKIHSSSRMPMKFKKAYKTKMLDQARLLQRHRKREHNLHDVHNAKAIPKQLQWFSPVGHLVSKQFQSKERLEKQEGANTVESESESSKINLKRSVEKALANFNETPKRQNIDQYYEVIKKLMKIGQNPYPIERQNKINIPSLNEVNDRFMEIYKEHSQKPNSVNRKLSHAGKHSSERFDLIGPVGILHFKQFTRDNNNVLGSKFNSKFKIQHSVQEKYKWPETINQVIQIENEQFKNAKSLRDVHELFESIGHSNKKLLKPNEREDKLDIIADKESELEKEPNIKKRKDIKDNFQASKEYNLLSQMIQSENLFNSERNKINIVGLETLNNNNLLTQMGSKFKKPFVLARYPEHRKQKNIDDDDIEMSQYNNVFSQLANPKADKLYSPVINSVEQKKKWISRLNKLSLSQLAYLKAELEKERHLRMHAVNEKSGEEGYALPKFSWDQTEVTTKPSRSAVPHYPFYNYWTYEKTIHQDKCRGNLIQLGQLCIKNE